MKIQYPTRLISGLLLTMILLSAFQLKNFLYNLTEPNQGINLKTFDVSFIIGAPVSSVSFDPLDSDALINALHAEQVVGTLVRLSPSGRYESYLAESWETKHGGTTWTFKLKTKLTCEDGTPITAPLFAQSLRRTISSFLNHGPIPIISELADFGSISDSKKDFAGISALDDHTLEFKFNRPVPSGFLEYLGLSFMGFYCSANYNSSGIWNDKTKIISSAAYKLSQQADGLSAVFKKRDDWVLEQPNAPTKVTVYRRDLNEDDASSRNILMLNFNSKLEFKNSEFTQIKMLPTILHSLTLSNRGHSVFADIAVRQEFRQEFLAAFSKSEFESSRTTTFYPHVSQNLDVVTSANSSERRSDSPVEILVSSKLSDRTVAILSATKEALNKMDLKFHVIQTDSSEKDLMKFRDSNLWDIRPTSVDIGGGIENQLVKFMFCSKLGVSFPDPSKRICKLADRFEKDFGDLIPPEMMAEYTREFDRIVYEDASVIPVLKSGKTWILSKDLNPSFVSPTAAIPHFDLIRLE